MNVRLVVFKGYLQTDLQPVMPGFSPAGHGHRMSKAVAVGPTPKTSQLSVSLG